MIEYKYEYYLAPQKRPNRNTNIICFQKQPNTNIIGLSKNTNDIFLY